MFFLINFFIYEESVSCGCVHLFLVVEYEYFNFFSDSFFILVGVCIYVKNTLMKFEKEFSMFDQAQQNFISTFYINKKTVMQQVKIQISSYYHMHNHIYYMESSYLHGFLNLWLFSFHLIVFILYELIYDLFMLLYKHIFNYIL